ncbi:MAG: ErfK/YbiS/YcfS/YnhG [candidate division CPR2 bacterium GW2011_GWC2_39_10]|uniref:ErfK/YbiS/YcfS/YnhG n=1 Tax=candidate division CPR2 bacterium GW2011_GWC2_39_10 TaxID=1618345 RepID=A0A0G0M3Z4_UNCC2|nr:MAG: ErfK/YbiS/YcfS/YnhG [candidate division CPR2 bacterium GW2011_GWC2_39_10]
MSGKNFGNSNKPRDSRVFKGEVSNNDLTNFLLSAENLAKIKDNLGEVSSVPETPEIENIELSNGKETNKVQVSKDKPKYKFNKKLVFQNVLLCLSLILVFSLPAVVFGFQLAYSGKVITNASLFEENLQGKTSDEIKAIVDSKLDGYKISVKSGSFTKDYSLDDLDVSNNSDVLIKDLMANGRNGSFWANNSYFLKQFAGKINLISSPVKEYSLNFNFNSKQIGSEITGLAPNFSTSENLVVRGIESIAQPPNMDERFYQQVFLYRFSEDLKTFGNVSLPDTYFNTQGFSSVQKLVNKSIVLKKDDKIINVGSLDITRFIVFDNNLSPKIDEAKIEVYINDVVVRQINIAPENKKIKVENFSKETVISEGKPGLAVDVPNLKQSIASAIKESQPEVIIKTNVVQPPVDREDIIVPDWTKYIDINLSTQTMTAFDKNVQVGQWKITSGSNYHPTPAGVTYIFGKTAITRMWGGTPGIDYYDLPNVHWVTWFRAGGYAIHEAYWRSAFGGQDYKWNGSHGCINAPIDVAKYIYDWAPIGTPVVVHY